MTRPFIVEGDKTNHGGTVIAGTPFTTTGGKQVARVGDPVPCPRCNAPGATIATGDQTIIIDDAPVACDGDKTSCGAMLISSQVATVAGSAAPSGATLAHASDAQTIEGLPPEALVHVLDHAYRAGVLRGWSNLTAVNPEHYSREANAEGTPVFSTQDEAIYLRLIRSNLGLAPYEELDASRVLNADPDMPEMRGLKSDGSSSLQPVAQIALHDSDWNMMARFADGRPVRGAQALENVPNANPSVRPQFSGRSAAATGLSGFTGLIQKIEKAENLGLKSRAVVYQDPSTDNLVVHVQGYKINVQGTALEPTTVTEQDALERLNKSSVSGLSETILNAKRQELNEFYRKHYVPAVPW